MFWAKILAKCQNSHMCDDVFNAAICEDFFAMIMKFFYSLEDENIKT